MLLNLLFSLAISSSLCYGKTDNYIKKSSPDLPSCDSKIYCQGDLLETVQLAEIFHDSKTFVDQKMRFEESVILKNFELLMRSTDEQPTKDQIKDFVVNNFEDGDELTNWTMPDYVENPKFISKISNESIKSFASAIVKIWPTLAREIKPEVIQNIEQYSMIPLPNGFVVPGGRFKETYYWDTYWIIKGLLISEMPETAKLMLENFLYMVDTIGFVPNGARIYYLNRSQPPLLTPMVRLYIDKTNDLEWLKKNIHVLDKELNWFLNNKTIQLEVNDKIYTLAHYDSESGSPRPESYKEDISTCSNRENPEDIKQCYADLKSGAESGWDFSFRWVFDEEGGNNADLEHIQTRRVIPVDLNSFLARGFLDLAMFYQKLGDYPRFNFWKQKSTSWQNAIDEILYNEKHGVWFDLDAKLLKHRTYFYPSNLAPLWAELYDPETAKELGRNAFNYLVDQKIPQFLGGTPTSLNNTGEQWDYPSAWAPLQSILIQGLKKSGDHKAVELSKTFATRWVEANMIGYERSGAMFEKYDAENPGQHGSGGEYVVQTGFGWTNGVALECIVDFFTT